MIFIVSPIVAELLSVLMLPFAMLPVTFTL